VRPEAGRSAHHGSRGIRTRYRKADVSAAATRPVERRIFFLDRNHRVARGVAATVGQSSARIKAQAV
jgi:hypothetical protein